MDNGKYRVAPDDDLAEKPTAEVLEQHSGVPHFYDVRRAVMVGMGPEALEAVSAALLSNFLEEHGLELDAVRDSRFRLTLELWPEPPAR